MILHGLASSIPWSSINVRVVAQELDGLAALRALSQTKPDIAIVDICMPRCDGLTLVEKALEMGLDTTFIILSGYDDFAYAQRAIRCGVTAYLLKPINKQELLNAVSEQCEKRRARTEKLADGQQTGERPHVSDGALLGQIVADVAGERLRDEEEIRTQMARLASPFPFDNLCVIVLDCQPQDHDAVLQALDEALFTSPHVLFLCEPRQLYIAAHVTASAGAMENLKKRLRECIQTLAARGIALTIAMGVYARTLLELPLSLRAARDARQYRMYELPDGLYDAAAIDYTPLPEGGARRWNAAKLTNAVLLHDEQAIRDEMDAFFHSLFYVPMPPPSYIIGMCSCVVMDVRQKLSSYAKDPDALPLDGIRLQLHAPASVSALKTLLLEALLAFSDDIAHSGVYKYSPIIDDAKAFIEQNLLKKLLLSDVAAHVHLSESYLAALFKSYTGQSFRNYLLERKMDKARSLLLMEHRSIGDVAEMLGYEDYRAFTRAFKKQTGLRPSDVYRHPSDERQEPL